MSYDSPNHRPLPSTRIVTMPPITEPVPVQEKRELYTIFAGKNCCQLGHLFESAHLAQQSPAGRYWHENSTRGVYCMLHPLHPWIKIHVTPSEALSKAWTSTIGGKISALTIRARSDGPMYNVLASDSPSSNYIAGLLTPQDVDFMVNEVNKPDEIALPA
jgi:hypothetical protein